MGERKGNLARYRIRRSISRNIKRTEDLPLEEREAARHQHLVKLGLRKEWSPEEEAAILASLREIF